MWFQDLQFIISAQSYSALSSADQSLWGSVKYCLLATTLSISADSGATPRRALKANREEQIHFVSVIEGEFAMKVDKYAPLNTPNQIDAVAQAIADSFSAA
ncbi:hypothetical protein CVT25_004213 [Psilocybe cyanescens]|uniref:Uncharacterized protein n=1 Tax=Psilocybe cyanescens TaxID=93625 RepID=A0A409XW32_PSICY|nr:hypothetical protein CVT25_004213 [Psilocybe cyanescens]